MRTAQEVFDIALNHLREQKRPAYIPGEGCQYRTPDGCKCAIGALIPDDKYDPRFDSESVNASNRKIMEAIDFEYNEPNQNLVTFIQLMHDSNRGYTGQEFLDRVEVEAADVARMFCLEYNRP